MTKKELLPKGNYQYEIVWTDTKDTKDGTGKYIELTFEVVKGKYSGQRVYKKFNIVNKSAEAVKYAKERLKWLKDALGFDKDTELNLRELKGKRLVGGTAVVEGKNGYSDYNDIVYFASIDSEVEKGPNS